MSIIARILIGSATTIDRNARVVTEGGRKRANPQSHRCDQGFFRLGIPYGIRTRAATLRGWSPRPLDERDLLLSALPRGWRCGPRR